MKDANYLKQFMSPQEQKYNTQPIGAGMMDPNLDEQFMNMDEFPNTYRNNDPNVHSTIPFG